jgi:hypothetical protein
MTAPQSPTNPPKWALDLLRCPITLESLEPASEELIRKLVAENAAGQLVNQSGLPVESGFDDGVVNQSGSYFHASRGGILTLIPGEAIPLN